MRLIDGWVMLVVSWCLVLPGCFVDEVSLAGKQCPCDEGWVCDQASNECLRAPLSAVSVCRGVDGKMIEQCQSFDNCCPVGCDASNDNDCSASCGDFLIDSGETCDPADSCPDSCDDGNACTINTLLGSAANCNAVCTLETVEFCIDNDGCCPADCDSFDDNDCSISCGNDVVETGETCDPPGSCDTYCDDGDSCTIDTLVGSASNCNSFCTTTDVSVCNDGDDCCPAGCNSLDDDDCFEVCGNGVVEDGELCDGDCPIDCDDGDPCTTNFIVGSPGTCTAECVEVPNLQC